MIDETLHDLILAAASGILFPLVLESIRKGMDKPTLKNHHRAFLFLVVAAVVFSLAVIVRPKPVKPDVYIAPTCEESSSILADGRAQYDVTCSGYVTHWSGSIYLVVNPVESTPPSWYVQQPARLSEADESGKRSWIGHALFYTARDEGENFNLYALAATTKYQGNETLRAEPNGYASEILTLKGHR